MADRASPIRTYEINVNGFWPPSIYSARSAAKARAACWRSYAECYEVSFRHFLKTSSVRRVPDPPGVGERIPVCGAPATRVIGHSHSHYVHFMRDDSDVTLMAHPADVQPAPAGAA